LNPPCAIEDTSWIKPGMCAWDHWWSGEVKMEMDVIKEYIDFAEEQGWPYMLIDWQWYGPYNKAHADITKPAPQLNMPEILEYARSKNVRCWLWLYCTDVNKNDSYKEAFALYEKWGIAGIKIKQLIKRSKNAHISATCRFFYSKRFTNCHFRMFIFTVNKASTLSLEYNCLLLISKVKYYYCSTKEEHSHFNHVLPLPALISRVL
jgi:hypothetical protein